MNAISSVLRRENALQGDAEVDGQEWLHVVVRLAAADIRHRCRHSRRRGWSAAMINRRMRRGRAGASCAGMVRCRRSMMPYTTWVCCGISEIDSVCVLLATCLAENMAALSAGMDRHPPRRSGSPKVVAPVAAIGGAEQREQRLVLIDRQQSARCTTPNPCGAKLNDIILISARNGSAMRAPHRST